MKPILSFLLITIFCSISVHGQNVSPSKLRISSGKCSANCGYQNGFHDTYFIRQLEFDLKEERLRFRKKTKNKFIDLEIQPPEIFTKEDTYVFLDSLYNNFTEFEVSRGKYFIYRIELIYYKTKIGVPAKIKTMDFIITTNPDEVRPKQLDDLIEGYNMVMRKKD